ncbi:RecX family transcriptional regulator [Prevotella sp. E13-17]|uniref:regulatory protein RecX n=1 Tax=Prevotella sp. E13-17 TaxID=2913616 RepID=UPI001EDC2B93|nr:regulatory protein RecX [Prevotella sp. E13-17]UKK50549.1 RecX family transcriptional regulator [Prevotella sp. E13-17]
MAIKKEMTGQQAYLKLTALCARSEHCQQEMLDKMRQWGVSEEERAQVMQRLVNERYVDDERFTRAFVNDKIRYNKWGRRKVEQALWMKRIDEHIARAILDEVDDEEYTATLTPMLKQKRRTTKANSDYELNMKLIKFALSRGFTMDIIKQCLDVEDESEFLD